MKSNLPGNNGPLIAALLQLRHHGDRQANLAAAQQALTAAAEAGAQLALLPELHLHHYFCQNHDTAAFDLAEPVPGPYTHWLAEQSQKLGLVIIGSVFERTAAEIFFNTAVVADSDGRIAGRYRKQHIPEDPGYHEKYYFRPGDGDLKCIDTSIGRLGVLICWDQWFPEPARILALDGADFLVYPTAIGWDSRDDSAEQQRQFEAWQMVQRGHAIANGLPVLACNRVGMEPVAGQAGQQFWGGSFAAGPQGELLAAACHDQEQLILATLDPARRRDVRRVWPFLRDRRIDRYQPLTDRSDQ